MTTQRNFPPSGISWLWVLNDECEADHIDDQIEVIAASGTGAVCLHPRPGLLFPYGGTDWFKLIRATARKCADRGIEVWLYDEDPYPSGNAGGRLIMEHPEYEAQRIGMFEAATDICEGELFCFPSGKLLWAGLVPCEDASKTEPIDLTAAVGVVRRQWQMREDADSRWYYPDTPIYKCARSDTHKPEYALKVPAIPEGMSLVAFVARPAAESYSSVWGTLADTLNPHATECFIRMTHERYRAAVGNMFGKEITAMFTDEPKYFGQYPWTPGMFEDFTIRYGYDLRPRLVDLFSDAQSGRALMTRLHYREWCGQRFKDAWLKPVSQWCAENDLRLVGHMSPEDDPVNQATSLSNEFPLMRHFSMPGLDLIIPAVGDARHPVINIGPIAATSVAQQECSPGVMSEMLACSGPEFPPAKAAQIVMWQTVMGVTTPVIHGIFSSTEGHRAIDAPPDFGPESRYWETLKGLSRSLEPFQKIMCNAKQIAPVAILWPIRSFQLNVPQWQEEQGGGMRGDLANLLLACLERQIGVHFIDEAILWESDIEEGIVRRGRAEYSHLVIPSSRVLHERTVDKLLEARDAGIEVQTAGTPPGYIQTDSDLLPVVDWPFPVKSIEDVSATLPRLVTIQGSQAANVRCSSWEKDGGIHSILMNIGNDECEINIEGRAVTLPAGVLIKEYEQITN